MDATEDLEGKQRKPDTHTAIEQRRPRFLEFLAKYGTLVGLAIMVAVFSALAPTAFPTASNLVNILNQSALSAIIAGGLTVIVLTGELDLSVGYNASLSGVLVVGLIVEQNLPIILAILVVVAFSVVIGIVNGLLVTKVRINSVIATLGVGSILVGLSYAYTTGSPIANGVPGPFTRISIGTTLDVPNDILIMAAVLIILWTIVNRTELGLKMQAVGGNVRAAEMSGIRVHLVKIVGFVLAAICASLTGILLASLIGSGTTGAADSYLLSAFAGVYLGAAVLRNGEFHILGTFIAVVIIGVGFNGLAIFGAPTWGQNIFQGLILIFAIGLSTVARLFARR